MHTHTHMHTCTHKHTHRADVRPLTGTLRQNCFHVVVSVTAMLAVVAQVAVLSTTSVVATLDGELVPRLIQMQKL